MNYQPAYDTKVTHVERTPAAVNTMHVDHFDWSYPFDDPSLWACYSLAQEQRDKRREEHERWLKEIEADPENAWVSDYGGWPRIWHKVLSFGMASAWPYWTPRPTIIVKGTLGVEWYDWQSLTGCEIRKPAEASSPTGGDK